MEMKKCPRCGHIMDDKQTQCIFCNEILIGERREQADNNMYNQDTYNQDVHNQTSSYDEMVNSKPKRKVNIKVVIAVSVVLLVVCMIISSSFAPWYICKSATKLIENGNYGDAQVMLEDKVELDDRFEKLYDTAVYEPMIAASIAGLSLSEFVMESGMVEDKDCIKVEEVSFYANESPITEMDLEETDPARPYIIAKLDMSVFSGHDDHRLYIFVYSPENDVYVALAKYNGDGTRIPDEPLSPSTSALDTIRSYSKVDIEVDYDRINKLVNKSNVFRQ